MNRNTSQNKLPYLGYGLGLRTDHYNTILDTLPEIDWLECLTENYLVPGGRPLHFLERLREHYPMVMHGVSMSLGSCDPLNMEYLQQVKDLADRINPQWISDHLCWTGVDGKNMHDLLPIPYIEESISHVVERLKIIQSFFGRQILIENVSSYLTYNVSEMSEWEFITEISERADCLILLDINNIYVSSVNHNFNPIDFLNGVPKDRVQQFHLAGHRRFPTHIVDTHDEPIINDVWDLYAEGVKRFGRVSTMIERDDNIPELQVLLDELSKAKDIAETILSDDVLAQVAS